MNAFWIKGLQEIWVANGTKFGKTVGAGVAAGSYMPLVKQGMGRWIAPIYAQSAIGYNVMRRMMNLPELIDTKDGKLQIDFKDYDSSLHFLHGQHPESLEGAATCLNVLDEAAKMKEAVYAAVKTTTTVTRAPIMLISTPFGKNWFYHGCMKAKEEMIRARAEGRPPAKIFITAPSSDNPAVTAEAIADARGSLPERLFSQYYLAQFVDDGGIFTCLHDAFGHATVFVTDQTWMAETHESKAIYIGADWAKSVDSSVFYGLNDGGRNIGFKRFNKLSYPEQVGSLFAFARQLRRGSTIDPNCPVYILHDKTGVGEAIDDIINATPHDFDIRGVNWNNANKEAGVNSLILSLEEKALQLFPWDNLHGEMSAFEVTTTASGRPRYAAPAGMHDDTVMAAVTANMLYRDHRDRFLGMGVIDSLNNVVRKIYFDDDHMLDEIT